MKPFLALLSLLSIFQTTFALADSDKYYLEKLETIEHNAKVIDITPDSQRFSISQWWSLGKQIWSIDGSSLTPPPFLSTSADLYSAPQYDLNFTKYAFSFSDKTNNILGYALFDNQTNHQIWISRQREVNTGNLFAVLESAIINVQTDLQTPMVAYDSATGNELWRKSVDYYVGDQLFFAGRFLYTFDWTKGTLRVIDPLTGALMMHATDVPNHDSWPKAKRPKLWECNDSVYLQVLPDNRLFEYSLKSFVRTEIYPLQGRIVSMSPGCQYVALEDSTVLNFRSGQKWSWGAFQGGLNVGSAEIMNVVPYRWFGQGALFSKTDEYVAMLTNGYYSSYGAVFNSKTGVKIGDLDFKADLTLDSNRDFAGQIPVGISADGNRVATYLPRMSKIAFWSRTIKPPTPPTPPPPPEDTPEMKLLKKWLQGSWTGKKILNFSITGTNAGDSSFYMTFVFAECNSPNCGSTVIDYLMRDETLWIGESIGQNQFNLMAECMNGEEKVKYSIGKLAVSEEMLDLRIVNLKYDCKKTKIHESFYIQSSKPKEASIIFTNTNQLTYPENRNWTDTITQK